MENTSSIRLPSLKTLKLEVGYVDADSLDVVLSGCSVLETLELCSSPEELGNNKTSSVGSFNNKGNNLLYYITINSLLLYSYNTITYITLIITFFLC